MDVMDYLIDLEGKDWEALLLDWRFLLPRSLSVWLVNRVGAVFAVFEDGSVHMLDVGRGSLERVADDCEQFVTRLDQDDHANTWMMVSLVNACVKAGMKIGRNQCYGFKIPPMLGGSYELDNLRPTDLSAHYHLLGEIYEQIRDLPRGTKVKRIEIKEP